ncbi:hypothetical protein GW17_00024120 [Ensete ventricosum]|nr:hypothetical protein GW17_00024120 [Ensete ventricosum]
MPQALQPDLPLPREDILPSRSDVEGQRFSPEVRSGTAGANARRHHLIPEIQPLSFPSRIPSLANQYVAVESLVARKREDQKRPRPELSRGQPSGLPRRRTDRPELPPLRPPPVPLNSTRTEIFLRVWEKGLLRAPNSIKMHKEGRDRRRYYRFHRDYRHDTKECHDLRNQIEDLIRQGHLGHYVRDHDNLLKVLPSAYNAIIDCLILNKLRAIVLIYHCAKKFPTSEAGLYMPAQMSAHLGW